MATTLRWHSCSKDDYPYRRHKVPQACDKCRAKKMRCNGERPCDRCVSTKVDCGYSIKKTTHSTTKRILGSSGKKTKPSLPPVSRQDGDSKEATLSTLSKRTSPQAQPRHKIFEPHLLKSMTFKSDYYNIIRNTTATSCFGSSQLPPLLFGFFSLSCQPYATWTTFIQLFRQHNNIIYPHQQQNIGTSPPPTLSTELSHEIMSLFGSHNYLYSAFMDMTQVMSFLTASSSTNDIHQQSPNCTDSQSVIVNSICALVFQAANQSLSHCCPEWSPLLQKQASLFYQHAHQLFISMTYPSSGKTSVTLDSLNLLDLTRASILLAHYQCVAVSEEQAYMTLQMGLGYAHRLDLYNLTSSPLFQFAGGSSNVKQMDCFKVLQKVLFGWQLWFSIYLHRSLPSPSLIYQENSPSIPPCKSEVRMENYLGKKGNQRWAVDVLDVYIQFFMKITNATDNEPLTQLDIQHHLKQMELWSSTFYSTRLNFTDIHSNTKSSHDNYTSSSRVRASQHLPAYVLSLYHQTLSIQILQTQQSHISQPPLLMPSPAPSTSRRDSAISSHSTIVSTPGGNNSLPNSPSSQNYTMDNLSPTQAKKDWDTNNDDDIYHDTDTTGALIRSATIILDTVDEIMVDDSLSDAHLMVGFGNREGIHSFVVYPLYVVTALLPTIILSVRQSLTVLPTCSNDHVIQRRQRYFIQQCGVLDEQISRLANILLTISSQLPFTNYLLQSIQGMISTCDTSSLNSVGLEQKDQEKSLVNDLSTKSTLLASCGGHASLTLSASVSGRSTLSPTPSSSSSSSSSSTSTSASMSTIPPSAIASSLPSSLSTTTAINRPLDKSSKPGVTQERLMAIPTMDHPLRLVMDQQQLDKLSHGKGITSSFSPSFTTTPVVTPNKRKLDEKQTIQQTALHNKKVKTKSSTAATQTNAIGEAALGIPTQYQLQPTPHSQQLQLQQSYEQTSHQQMQPQHQQSYSDTFSTSNVMTTRYLDQLNGLSEQSQLQQIYSTDCLTDDHLWMAFVGNSSLASSAITAPPASETGIRSRRSRLPTDGLNDNTTPKLPLPHIKHRDMTIPKSWSAAGAPINVDWNVCFSAEMNRTLHQNGSQQPISLDIATAAAAAASLEPVDSTIQMNMPSTTPSNQDNVLFLLSQQQQHQQQHHHRQSGDAGYFPTSSTWGSVDSDFF